MSRNCCKCSRKDGRKAVFFVVILFFLPAVVVAQIAEDLTGLQIPVVVFPLDLLPPAELVDIVALKGHAAVGHALRDLVDLLPRDLIPRPVQELQFFQVIERRDIRHGSVGKVQQLEVFASGQRAQVAQVPTAAELKHVQLFAVFQRAQIRDVVIREDRELELRHIAAELDARQRIVPEVDVLGLRTVAQHLAHLVGEIGPVLRGDRVDDLGVRQVREETEVHAPDHLHTALVLVAQRGHRPIADAAVLDLEIAAVGHALQRLAELLQSLVADLHAPEFQALLPALDLNAEQFKALRQLRRGPRPRRRARHRLRRRCGRGAWGRARGRSRWRRRRCLLQRLENRRSGAL